MNFSEVFIRRPIATSLLMAAIALFGVVAYRSLPVSDMPNVEMPTLQVQVNLPGADPDTMASSVATVLERQFTSISGIDSMRSQSSTGQTQITLQFDMSRDIDGASVDVQTAIAEAMPLLPAGLTRAAVLQEAEPFRPTHFLSHAYFRRDFSIAARRLCGDDDRSAHLDGQRRIAGASGRRDQVCGPRAARSRQTGRQENRHQ